MFAATHERPLPQRDFAQDLAVAAHEQIGLWRRVRPWLLGATFDLELLTLSCCQRGHGVSHDASVDALQAELTQHE